MTTHDHEFVPLRHAPGARAAWGAPAWKVYLWSIVELLFVANAWQPSSALRIRALRLFGAEISEGVIFRPRTRVKFPWKLHVGRDSWIGEGVWFHNQDHIFIDHDVVLSQETFLTTGSHRHRTDMGLITSPIHIAPGAWVTSRCIILGGTEMGPSSLAKPGTVVSGLINPFEIVSGPDCTVVGKRELRGK